MFLLWNEGYAPKLLRREQRSRRLGRRREGKRAVMNWTQPAVFHVAQDLPEVFTCAAAAANERQVVEIQVADVQLRQNVAGDAANDQHAAAWRQGADAPANGIPATVVHHEVDAA